MGDRAARISVARQLVSAASLARFTGSVAAMARESGPGARGLQAAAAVSGALAAASLAASALTTARLASGCAGALSPLGLVAEPAVLLIPAGRVSGLVVSGIAGARLS
jgi:hypothetical protein